MNWLLTIAFVGQLIIQGPPKFPLVSSSSTLNTSLIAYWKLDETSNGTMAVTRVDSQGSNDLTDNNTTANGTGIISNGADLELSNSERLTIADNAALSGSDRDFTIAMWVNMESVPTGNFGGISKYSAGGGQRDYRLYFNGSASAATAKFTVTSDGTNPVEASATTFGTLSASNWYLVVGYHSATSNLVGIAVNAGAHNTTSHTTGVFNGTETFIIGAAYATGQYFDGIIDEVGFWDKVLTAGEITELYNSGAGKTCCPF